MKSLKIKERKYSILILFYFSSFLEMNYFLIKSTSLCKITNIIYIYKEK